MNEGVSKFDIKKYKGNKLEEISYKIVNSFGLDSVEWFKGPGDRGRDIIAHHRFEYLPGVYDEKRYIFAVNGQSNSLSMEDLKRPTMWADVYHKSNELDYLVIMTSSSLKVDTRDYILGHNKSRGYKIAYYEGHWINEYIKRHPELIEEILVYSKSSPKRGVYLKLIGGKELKVGSSIGMFNSEDKLIKTTTIIGINGTIKVGNSFYKNQVIAEPNLGLSGPALIFDKDGEYVGISWAGSDVVMLINPFSN